MSEVETPKGRTQFVWVKDRAGNEFVCPLDALKGRDKATEEELKSCINDATSPQPYAGG